MTDTIYELKHPADPAFDNEPCAMPHEHAIRSLMIEQDYERAKLRGIITELEKVIRAAGLEPFHTAGESAHEQYLQTMRALNAVCDYFGNDRRSMRNIPAELHDVFRPLLIT